MSNSNLSSRPVHCAECSKPLASPICCTNCGALNPLPPESINYFDLFYLERKYEIDADELHKKYLCLSRTTHPDMVDKNSPTLYHRALALNAELNRAYDTLRDPVRRAEYLLTLAGSSAGAESKSVPGSLLGEVMARREEIEEAKQADDPVRLQSIREVVEQKRQNHLRQIAALAGRLDQGDAAIVSALREQLNSIKYWDNLLEYLAAR